MHPALKATILFISWLLIVSVIGAILCLIASAVPIIGVVIIVFGLILVWYCIFDEVRGSKWRW